MCSSRKNPYPPHGRSSEITRGRGVLKAKTLEAKYEAKLEFPGGTGDAKQKTFCGGSMDIFWNPTILLGVVFLYYRNLHLPPPLTPHFLKINWQMFHGQGKLLRQMPHDEVKR